MGQAGLGRQAWADRLGQIRLANPTFILGILDMAEKLSHSFLYSGGIFCKLASEVSAKT